MWLTALIMGFTGSMHCLGMCSPLAAAVTGMKGAGFPNRLLYHGGRILTYGLMGAFVAGIGVMLPLHRYQNILSLALGAALLYIGFGGVRHIRVPGVTVPMQKLTAALKRLFADYLKRKRRDAVFFLGMLNGLLPCGLTFIALSWCVTLQGPLDGFNFMMLFGAGTLPAMLGLTAIFPWMARKLTGNMRQLTTGLLIISGCLLIARAFIVHAPDAAAAGHSPIEAVLCR